MRILVLSVALLLALGVGGVSALYQTNYRGWWDLLAGTDDPEAGPVPAIELPNAFPALKFDLPLWFGHAGDASGDVYVVEQDGRIWRFKNEPTVTERKLFLDITERMPTRRQRHNEEGLLALAFHPNFEDNGFIFVNYSQLAGAGKQRRGVTSRFTVDPETGIVALKTERIILEVEQPWGNHNGCDLHFGPDGYLYLSFGDGGSAGDPRNDSQNLGTLLGTVLRIDVDNRDEGKAYAIPKDNPFVDREGARPEIWAYGLRNVWRMAFDPKTGLLYGADVGQVTREEVNIIEKGGNYGWRAREGFTDFRPNEVTEDMIDPIIDYERRDGISITGGFVYRGKLHEALQGVYIYGDYGTGRFWGLRYDHERRKLLSNQLIAHSPRFAPSSFGVDAEGEVYAVSHTQGTIHRIVPKE